MYVHAYVHTYSYMHITNAYCFIINAYVIIIVL